MVVVMIIMVDKWLTNSHGRHGLKCVLKLDVLWNKYGQ